MVGIEQWPSSNSTSSSSTAPTPENPIAPLKGSYTRTQNFGVKYSYTDAAGVTTNSVGGGSGADWHAGWDGSSTSREVQAVLSGKVIFAGDNPASYGGTKKGTGRLMIISYGNGRYVLYGHMGKGEMNFLSGDSVKQGAVLGKYSATAVGVADGPHFHYEEYETDKDFSKMSSDEIAGFFFRTGYFYDKDKLPDDLKAKNSNEDLIKTIDLSGRNW